MHRIYIRYVETTYPARFPGAKLLVRFRDVGILARLMREDSTLCAPERLLIEYWFAMKKAGGQYACVNVFGTRYISSGFVTPLCVL